MATAAAARALSNVLVPLAGSCPVGIGSTITAVEVPSGMPSLAAAMRQEYVALSSTPVSVSGDVVPERLPVAAVVAVHVAV